MTNPIAPRLLDVLACPCCAKPAPLTPAADGSALICSQCQRSFAVHEGIVSLHPNAAKVTTSDGSAQ